MVYTLTFNPSLDMYMTVENFKQSATNRSSKEHFFAGGKGINVSAVLNEFEIKNKSFIFVGGFVGKQIKKLLKGKVNAQYISLKNSCNRINVKFSNDSSTEINSKGPEISDAAINRLCKRLGKIKKGDIFILSGSGPINAVDKVLKAVSTRGALIVGDLSGEALKKVLEYSPFLVKPNLQELYEFFGEQGDIDTLAKKLLDLGAKNVLVSLGADGALFKNDTVTFSQKAPEITAKNCVGAGDSMVAGFIAGYLKAKDFKYALTLGIAAGSATAQCSSLAKKEDIEKLYNNI